MGDDGWKEYTEMSKKYQDLITEMIECIEVLALECDDGSEVDLDEVQNLLNRARKAKEQ